MAIMALFQNLKKGLVLGTAMAPGPCQVGRVAVGML